MKGLTRLAMLMLLASVYAVAQLKVGSISSLEQLRAALKAGESIKVGTTQINSVRFANELRIAHDRTMAVLTGQSTGALALFKPDGRLTAVIETGRLVSYQFAELGRDGTEGILTDEILGIGTGVVIRRFKLYSPADNQEIKVLWQAPSYVLKAPWSNGEPSPEVSEEYGYVRFDPGSGVYPARISYAFRDRSGHWSVKLYSLASGTVRAIN